MRFGVAATLMMMALLLTGAGPSAATSGRSPELMRFWRTFFARPSTVPQPADNPSAPEKRALGERLFQDQRLSGDATRACASCHQPERAFTDGRVRALAIDGTPLLRNTPALWNLAWGQHFYWDGRAASLEEQARFPIEHPREMAADWPTVLARLRQDQALAGKFASTFPESPGISDRTVLMALAAYERSLISPPARFDRWIEGDDSALTSVEQAGFGLFVGKAGCVGCHAGWRFTDDRFHDIGLPGDDPGRGAVPGGIPGLKAFKTPSLRELTLTAPYMHDGSKPSLDEVLEHYTGGFVDRIGVSSNMVRGLRLETQERASIVAFLRSLSSPGRASGN